MKFSSKLCFIDRIDIIFVLKTLMESTIFALTRLQMFADIIYVCLTSGDFVENVNKYSFFFIYNHYKIRNLNKY